MWNVEEGSGTALEIFWSNLGRPCYGEAEGARDEDMAQKYSFACLWLWQEQGLRTLFARMGALFGYVGSLRALQTWRERLRTYHLMKGSRF